VGGVDRRRTDHHLRPVRPEQGDLLGGDLVGHGEDAAVATAGGDDGQAHPGVARCRFDDGPARAEETVALGRVDHGDRGAVLDAAAGIEEFQLGQQLAGQVPPDPVEPDQWCVADQVQQRVGGLDHRTRIADRGHRDGRVDLDGYVTQHLDRKAGLVQLEGHSRQPVPAPVAVGRQEPDRAGDVGAQVGDDVGWQRAGGDVHPPAGTCGQAPGDFGSIDYDQDVHGDTPIMSVGREPSATGRRPQVDGRVEPPGPPPGTRPGRRAPRSARDRAVDLRLRRRARARPPPVVVVARPGRVPGPRLPVPPPQRLDVPRVAEPTRGRSGGRDPLRHAEILSTPIGPSRGHPVPGRGTERRGTCRITSSGPDGCRWRWLPPDRPGRCRRPGTRA
jgi:hypothetical protein